ncbi:MAG TPA: hypothetical protein HPP77_08525 [Candidatus Hydrogenedentes bacterium]|nr:hypothetical protein [Candidatus Hydrogenedentota bacterium]
MQLPLAQRELRRGAKLKRTYVLRVLVLGAALLVLTFIWLIALVSSGALAGLSTSASFGEQFGRGLAVVCTFFQVAVVFLIAPVLCAGRIAEEKEERTLGLLMLADFHGWDIFLAKFLATFLQSELLILSTLPLLSLASFMGGVSVPAMALQVFLISVWAASVCALALLFSTLAKRPIEALFATLLCLFAWIVVAAMADSILMRVTGRAFTVNIARAAFSADNPYVRPFYWVPSVILTLGFGIGCSVLAIFLLPRQIFERARRVSRWHKAVLTKPRTLLPMSPAARVIASSARGLSGVLRLMLMRLLVAGVLFVLATYFCVIGRFVILVLFLFDVTTFLATARSNGAMDDVRVAPIDDKPFARAVLRAVFSKAWPYLPSTASYALTSLFYLQMMTRAAAMMTPAPQMPPRALICGWYLPYAALDAAAVFLFIVMLACFLATLSGSAVKQTVLGLIIAGCYGLAAGTAITAINVRRQFLSVSPFLFPFGPPIPEDYSQLWVLGLTAAIRIVPYAFLAYVFYRVFLSRCRDTLGQR